MVQIKIFFGLSQNLTRSAFTSTSITILISSKKIMSFLNFIVLLLSGLLTFYWLIAPKTMKVTFFDEQRELAACFSFDISAIPNNFLSAI